MELFVVILVILCIFLFVKIRGNNRKIIETRLKYKEEYLKKLEEAGLEDEEYEYKEEKTKYLPYKIKKTIMTEHERLLFETLKSLLEPKYSIYPQVNLSKVFDIEYQKLYKYYIMWFRKISQKSVDFLVVNKNTQSPLFAIELDDSSHEREDRQERDKFVNEIFNRNNFPLIRFNPGNYKPEELKSVFQRYLN